MVSAFPWSWIVIFGFSLLFSCANDIMDHNDGDPDGVDCIADCDD